MQQNDFTTLKVWQEAHQLMLDVYKFCEMLPQEEKYGLIIQLKRSVSSIAANISEGYGRYYFQDNMAFCRKARGSLDETRNHIIKARDLKFASKDECEKLLRNCLKVRMLLNGFIRHLNNSKSV